MTATQKADRRALYAGIAVTGVWLVSFLGARMFLDKELQHRLQLDPWIRVTAALIPVAPTAVFLWWVIRGIRSLDELHRRVHLEALAIAFPLAILLLMTLGLLELAIKLPPEDWSYRHVWVFLPLFYFGGLAISWRRYQ